MNNKKLVVLGFSCLACVFAALFFMKGENNDNTIVTDNNIKTQQTENTNVKASKKEPMQETLQNKKENIQVDKTTLKADLFPNSNEIPLSAIINFANISPESKNTVKQIIDSNNNIFFAKQRGDKLLLIVENQANIRHGIDFVEISLTNGHQTRSTLGYSDKIQDSDNDIWEYNKNSEFSTPTKHVKFDKNGTVEFIETWNYDPENPIKYEMKNAEGKTLSIRKETLSNDSDDMRVEHLIYDKDGVTKINVSATYEGADVKRFTYYNADSPSDGASIFSEYTDGNKTKEILYTSDLKLQNSYISKYKDGVRTGITVLDTNDKEIANYSEE